MKKIEKNLSKALCIIIYFIILFFAYTRMNLDRLAQDIQVFSGAFLVLGILALEKAYKKDSGEVAITGIELLALSIHSLSIMHMITLLKYDFKSYMLISSGIVVIYYVLKVIIIYTKDKKEYLKGLSDISKIVKEDEPIKKEAKKRNKNEKEKEETEELESAKENQNKETNNTEIKQNKDSKTKTNSKRKQAKKVNESKNKEKPKTKAKSNKKVIEDKTEKQSKETKTEAKKKKIENVEEKTKNEKRKKSSSVKTKKVEKEVKEND
ncbi:unknown [Clostridium sp. CAG:343]|nr:unknown [Clostridium sp. CAG:343]